MGNGEVIPPPPGLGVKTPQSAEPPGLGQDEIAPPPGLGQQDYGLQEFQVRVDAAKSLENAIQLSDDPEEEQAGVINSYSFSRIMDMPLTKAHVMRNEIAAELVGDDKTTQKTFWQKLKENVATAGSILTGAPSSAQAGIKAGLIQEKLYEEAFQLSLEALTGNWNQERYNTIAGLQEQITALAPGEKTGFLNQVVWDVGQILPGMIGAMKEGAIYGLGTGLAAAIAGTTVPGVGTATAAGGGFLFGFGAGMASHSFRQMRGKSWLTLSQIRDDEGNPIPQSIVQIVSFAAGALNAAIEVGQMGTLIKTVPGARRLLEKSVGNAFDEVVKNGTLRSKILERLAEFGKYWTTEVGEELLQEIVDIVSEHVSIDLSNALTARPRTHGGLVFGEAATRFEHATVLEDFKRLADTFIHSAPALAILGAPGNVMGTIQEVAAFKRDKAETLRADAALQGVDLTEQEVDAQVDDELLRIMAEGARIETPTTEVKEPSPLARRLAVAPEERIAPPPVNERLEIAAEIEDTAEKERVISGNIPLQEILAEEEISERQKVRKAYYAGKKTGTKTEKARKTELIGAQRQKHQLRVYINKLAAQIARKPGKSIDFFYREAIENLQVGIDPHFRRRDTLESRERTRQFIERRPEAREFIPKKVLTILEKKSLNELTVAELETLRNEIDILRKIGRTKKQLTWIGNERDYTGRRDELLSTVLKGEKLVEEVKPVVRATMEKGIIKKAYRFMRAFTLRPSRIFDKLDGGAQFKGQFHQVFYNEVNEKENGKIRAIDARLEAGEAEHKKLKISLADLAGKKTTVDGVDYTLDEALDIYAGMKNESKTLAIYYGNNIDPKIAEQIIASLTPEEKALADHIIADYEKRYEPLRNAHIAFMDEDLGHEENYTPIRRTDVEYQAMNEELRDELLRKTHLKKGYAEKGFTISRQEIPPGFQKPIRLGLYATWLDQVPKQENYIAYAEKVRELHRLLNDKQLSAAIKQKAGDEYYTAARHYVDRVANPNIYKAFSKFERVSRVLRKHTALAYLAYNLVTMVKQLPSVFFYLGDVGPGRLIASMLEFAFHPFETMEFVNERDPQIKHRSIEREMEELKRYDSGAFERIIKAVGKPGMIGIYALDKIAVTIGWKAVYEANIKKGLSEAEAIREAQNATLRTQPAAHPKDIAELYATNEVLNWFTQFTNQLSQIYNITTYDIPQDFKNHRFYRGMLEVFGLSLSSLVIWAISNRRLPEKPEDFMDAGKDTALNAIPLVGRGLAAKDEGYSMGGPAPIEGITDLVTLYKSADWARKPVADWFTDRRFRKSMDKALEAIAVLFGIPYTGPKRVIKAIEKQDIRELIGGEPKR